MMTEQWVFDLNFLHNVILQIDGWQIVTALKDLKQPGKFLKTNFS
jgi:hypothetical protein